ncbi:hypothetical protein SAY87_009961 [Trapa incisa]|uniref:Uncharacterized protein n=1 Tax=Trapa incisa TaxID=236973 RepID=A0AAN7JH74_9MYRT|nr:hypothetical protein SAY87_009961 [Trapa incisa]
MEEFLLLYLAGLWFSLLKQSAAMVKAQAFMAMASSHLSPHARWIFPRSHLFLKVDCVGMCMGWSLSEEPRQFALGRETLREPIDVGAVVVDHVLLLDPPNPVPPRGIQNLVLPGTILVWVCPGARGRTRCPYTCIDIDVPEGGSEGGVCPVGLHTAAHGGPVVGIPQARVYPHGLVLREGDSYGFQVVEYPYGNVVHQESVVKLQKV